ncbi:MAG TPA: TldD/PmbA family protein [Thermoanaerobaculia bacterium]|nr:TldD/PmbA family protein [Thermoanaerobaculia bacterium]
MISVERELAEDAEDAVRIVSGLLRRGDHGEAFRERRRAVSWAVSEAGLLTPGVAEERGTAVRIRHGREAICFAREGDGPESLREVVRDASRRAGGSPFLKARLRPAPAPAAATPVPAEEGDAAVLAAALARALPDPRGLALQLTLTRTVVTRAVITARDFLRCGSSSRLLASGVIRRSDATRSFAFQSAQPFAAAAEALSRALREAVRPVPTAPPSPGTVDVVLSPAAASVFWHEAVGHPLEAEGGHRQSALSRVPSAAVAPPGLDVTDDPTAAHLPGSYLFDDEGTAARRVPLIEDGRIVGVLTDRRTGGAESNGHGRAADYRRPPRPRLSNLVVSPGGSPLEELLERCGSGLFIREISAGSLEPESGRFFFLVSSAETIRRGRAGAPVSPFALSGDVLAALHRLDPARGGTARPAEGLGLCVKGGEALPVGGSSPAILLRGLLVTPGRS